VRISNKALISTDFPDDTVWVNDEIVLWGCKNVTVAIGEILTRLGAEVSKPILEDNGWALNISYKDREPWCLVHDGVEHIYFYIEDRWGARGDPAAYVELIVQLNAELHRDPRFHDIRWYDSGDQDFDGPTSPSPVT
jgi:hypothetical protein